MRHSCKLTLNEADFWKALHIRRYKWRHCDLPRFAICTADLANPTHSMSQPTIQHLLTRRSVSANSLGEPGPEFRPARSNLDRRGQGSGPQEAGALALHSLPRRCPGGVWASAGRNLPARRSPSRAPSGSRWRPSASCARPLVIAVISRVARPAPAPEWEQVLSAGAACQNLVVAASALGFGVNWVTEWYAYSEGVDQATGPDGERAGGGFCLYRYRQGEA